MTGKTKTAVRDKLRDLQRQVDDGVPVANGALTFGQLLDRWLADALPSRSRVTSQNTRDNYRWAAERHLKPALGSKRLRTLRPEDVEGLLQRMAAEGKSRNTVVRVRSVAVAALKWAQRRDLVARNAAELSEVPAEARAPDEGRSLTVEQAKTFLEAAAGDRLEGLVVTGLMLGLRPGELLGLRWDDVDLDAGHVHVRQALKRERGALVLGEVKTKRSRRSLTIPTPVVEALRAHRARQAAERLRAGQLWQEHGLVFASEVGTPIDPSNLRRTIHRIATKAGLGHWHPHELRHSAASLLSAAGVPLESVADLLGHVDTRMLERVYRHGVKPTVDVAVTPMEAMFGTR